MDRKLTQRGEERRKQLMAYATARFAQNGFHPTSVAEITEGLGEPFPPTWPSVDAAAELSRIEAGRAVQAPDVLFKKIEDTQVEEWTQRFGGAEA